MALTCFFVRVSGELGWRFLAILRVRSGCCVSLAELMPRVYYSNLSCLVVKWTIYVLACRPKALWGLTNSETATFNWVHRPYLQAVYFKKSYRAFLGLKLQEQLARSCHLSATRPCPSCGTDIHGVGEMPFLRFPLKSVDEQVKSDRAAPVCLWTDRCAHVQLELADVHQYSGTSVPAQYWSTGLQVVLGGFHKYLVFCSPPWRKILKCDESEYQILLTRLSNLIIN